MESPVVALENYLHYHNGRKSADEAYIGCRREYRLSLELLPARRHYGCTLCHFPAWQVQELLFL